MVCRGLMLALHRAGHIELPAKRQSPPNNAMAHRRVVEVPSIDTTPIEMSLEQLGPLELRLVRRAEGEKVFAHLLHRYHYLGYSRPVGEHLKYLVLAQGRPIACVAWNSGPLKLKLRDDLVGASHWTYAHHLHWIAYNSRYLIVPWVKVPHLASHLLARMARQISADWQELYAHPIWLLESFVDSERFEGTCYRAANWRCLGFSRGRGTKSRTKQKNTSLKAVTTQTPSPQSKMLARHRMLRQTTKDSPVSICENPWLPDGMRLSQFYNASGVRDHHKIVPMLSFDHRFLGKRTFFNWGFPSPTPPSSSLPCLWLMRDCSVGGF